jgi:Gpi18-like mannosyltransferase
MRRFIPKPAVILRASLLIYRIFEWFKTDSGQIIFFVAFTRIILVYIGILAHIVQAHPEVSYLSLSRAVLKEAVQPFGHADVRWYMDIALNGYLEKRFATVNEQVNWAFFPLWPLILRITAMFSSDLILAGMILSSLSFGLAAVFLYKLLRLDSVDVETAKMATLFLILFPSAYFTLRPGPEGLFLLLVVGAFVAARTHHWYWAGILGALATLSRPQGVLLFFPLLYMYYGQYKASRVHQIGGLSLFLIPISLFGFMTYIYQLSGNLLAIFLLQDQEWDNQLTFPFRYIASFIYDPKIIDFYGLDLAIVSIPLVVLATVITIRMLVDKNIPREYVIYTVCSLFLIVSRNNTNGSLRYMLPIFPFYLALAHWIRPHKGLFLCVSFALLVLQIFYFIAFMRSYSWATT